MNYPLISDYIEAIHSAEDNFNKLTNLRPVLDGNGNPVMSSGNFAVVFKMRDINTNKLLAVKCFTRDQEKREERYKKITEELQYIPSTYILHTQYLERELFVSTSGGDEELPVLAMDWIEGHPIDVYLKQHINDKYALQMLAYNFCKMGAWLLSQPFAHGDLKPDNILVRADGSLVLVDYDGMYVPLMEGEIANEIGSPDFRHPLRTEQNFNEHIDDFAITTIALSLKAIALDPSLYNTFGAADRLLLSANDYNDLGNSAAFQAITKLVSDTELSTILSLFLLAYAKNTLSSVSFRLLIFPEPDRSLFIQEKVLEKFTTKITNEERAEAITDKYGAKYTKDGLKLIEMPNNLTSYTIKEGTKVIGNSAFYGQYSLKSLNIPNSVISIGDVAFGWCNSLKSITIPNSVTSIGSQAFNGCSSLQSINIPNGVTSIGSGAFNICTSLSITISGNNFFTKDDMLISSNGALISCWSTEKNINIPNSVTSIGNDAFCVCKSLQSINIPNGVTSIGDKAFGWCNSLKSITIPDSVTSIGSRAFCLCI